jgi:hypothetical protein
MSLSGPTHGPSESLNYRLNLYSVAAVTAGVSLLALAKPAKGSVVVTKANIEVNFQTPIDLNHDGVNDVMLINDIANYDHSFYGTFAAAPLNGGKIVGGNRGILGPYASALAKGGNIGPSAHFSSSAARQQITLERFDGSASGFTFITYYGPWKPGTGPHYLGVKFLIKGEVHYGWVLLNISSAEGTKTVTEYAYETVANKKIGAGATSDTADEAETAPARQAIRPTHGPSLGMLARGTDALALWRREQDQCVQS